jgi:TolA-binding protein
MTSRLIALLVFTAAVSAAAREPSSQKTPEPAAQAPVPVAPEQHAVTAPDQHAVASAPAPGQDPTHAEFPPAPTPVASPAPHAGEAAAVPQFSIHPPTEQKTATPEEIASLIRIGQSKIEQGDYVSSELAFRQVLAEKATPEQDHAALMGLARTYRKKAEFTKATAVYETLIKQSPDDPHLPIVYLELGRTLRALGAYKSAIARFYSVINSTLKLPEDNPDNYRQLARTAQFEIAETYFQSGDYEQANRFFSRLKLLDLAPEDRARAHFKSVYALVLAKDYEKAASGFRAYLDQNPNDENVPEARYLLASSLRNLGRYNESLAVALELLRAEKKYVDSDPKRWSYWQRKTGNQLANQFYEQGDFGSALIIYQNLASLSPEPSWRLPVLYQVGLCNERLKLTDRARECYQTIVDNTKPSEGDGPRRQELVDLYQMADWRLKHLVWEQTTDHQLAALFLTDTAQASNPAAIDHDPNGSPAKSPVLVR